jgi:hypothetical protein
MCKYLIIIMCLVFLIAFSSCNNMITSNYCELYKPISLDVDKDTPQTMREVLYNNEIYKKFCAGQ